MSRTDGGVDWTVGARWAVALVEPLLQPTHRERLEVELADAVEAHPRWGLLFLSGVVLDLAQALPADDAWRQGVMAGTIADHVDRLGRTEDPSLDETLAAAAEGVEMVVVDVVRAAAATGVSREVVDLLRTSSGSRPARLVEIATSAIRWTGLRYRAAVGGQAANDWMVATCWWRAEVAARCVEGGVDLADVARRCAERVIIERSGNEAARLTPATLG